MQSYNPMFIFQLFLITLHTASIINSVHTISISINNKW